MGKKLMWNPIKKKNQKLDEYGSAARKIYKYRIKTLGEDSKDVLEIHPKLIFRDGILMKLKMSPKDYIRKKIQPQIILAEQSDETVTIPVSMEKMNDNLSEFYPGFQDQQKSKTEHCI